MRGPASQRATARKKIQMVNDDRPRPRHPPTWRHPMILGIIAIVGLLGLFAGFLMLFGAALGD